MRIHLIKEKEKLPRMSTILNIIQDALEREEYTITEVNHGKGFIEMNPDRGVIKC